MSCLHVVRPPRRRTLVSLLRLAVAALAPMMLEAQGTAAVADELLAADRAYATAASSRNVVEAISALVATDVLMPVARAGFLRGRDAVSDFLRRDPDNLSSRLEWSPHRVGVSADGAHGFTFGFMQLAKADSTRVPMKYLAYWVKGAEGWKAVAYRRVPRPAGQIPAGLLAPSLPERLVPDETDQVRIEAHRRSLADAERAFSDEARRVGLGEAFRRNADPTAMNMGGPQSPGFVIGPDEIGRSVGRGQSGPSPLQWGADVAVVVASSGDLGVTFGYINGPPPADAPAGTRPAAMRTPFFTIWRRAAPSLPWRFIAE